MPDAVSFDPFHPGERLAQEYVGVRERMAARGGRFIREAMPEQHREFFGTLPFVAVATADHDGWPCGTLVSGTPGFITSPDPRTLQIGAAPVGEDPTGAALIPGSGIGLLGIDFVTRRRNRANGVLTHSGERLLEVAVQQSFGNCAQYIQSREIVAGADVDAPQLERLASIDDAAGKLIASADTFFVASAAGAAVDMSHRGGRPGFVRQDGDMLTIPDFSGNRYFNTFGNFLVSPRAGLLFVDFERGYLLHLSGEIEIVWDSNEVRQFAGAERLWRVRLSHGWWLRGALPWRWIFRENAPTTERTGTWTA